MFRMTTVDRHPAAQRTGSGPRSRTALTLAVLAGLLALTAAPQALSATYRWAGSSNRIYIEGGGTATLSAIQAALPVAPLVLVDATNKVWMLSANIVITGGTKLVLRGTTAGGDVNELRLKSTNTSAVDRFVYITAEHGDIDIHSTKITSWNSPANGPDTEYASFGRAFIRVRSFLALDGVTPLESRMDIVNSEISHLGYEAAESYGLVWKVNGTGPTLYDDVQVRGDIIDSHIHHNYYGVYTFGLQSAKWLNNEVNHNVGYGFDPHDDSDDLLIDGNNVHHNGNHGIIASKRCDNVVITNNHTWANTGNGIMLHRSSNQALVENNLSEDNLDSGVALFASEDIVVRNNRLLGNDNTGIRLSMGASGNTIDSNEIAGSGKYGIYFYMGTDTPEPGSDGRNRDNTFINNDVHDNLEDAVKMSESDDNTFIGNTFAGNGPLMQFESSSNSRFTNNAIPAGVTFQIEGTSAVPTVVKFTEQPRIKLALDSFGSAQFVDAGSLVFDTSYPVFSRSTKTPAQSVMDIDSTDADNAIVYTRDFSVKPQANSVDVNPTKWQKTGAREKAFKMKSAVGGTTINLVVGDLAAGVSYDVFRGATKIKTQVADAAGRIAFLLRPPTTGTFIYSVKPTP